MTKTHKEWFHFHIDDTPIKNLIDQRKQAKLSKNWPLADQIRQDLLKDGIVLEDTSDGETIWRKS